MMFVMHHAFRRDLTALHAAAAATPLGARDTWRALGHRWATFSFVLHHHHHGEDEGYWPLLLQRVPAADRATLQAEALDHLDAHLAHEETDALPLLQRHLTREEDERIEREHFRAGIPVRMLLRSVPWALHQVPERERAHVLAVVGPAYAVLWRLTRRRFARDDRAAMRYVM